MLESARMIRCLNLVFVVTLMSGICQDADGIKPKMTPDIDEIFLDRYDELKIECYSKDARIQFSFPESTFFVRRSHHEIRVSGNGTYTFLRRNADISDAGWYACAEERVKIDNDFRIVNHTDKDVSWIYVYVKDTEGKTGFVYRDSGLFAPTIISLPGSVVVIPCRPTQPTTKVELRQDFKLVDLDKEAVRFDPKIGFIMEQVEFSENRAVFHCTTETDLEAYILLFLESRPTMITPEEDKDVTLREGDVLRIECSSESKLSFLYPTILTNSSEYEIVKNENGTSTFLRRSVASDDTGWYGCAGMDIGNNDIPAYSINYTKKEISWVYVYVNSPVRIISPPVYTAYHYLEDIFSEFVLPCRPTTPESDIHLERWNGKIWDLQLDSPFDPRVGYLVTSPRTGNEQSVHRCVMTNPVFYVSKNYSLADIEAANKQLQETAVVLQVDDPSNSDDLIIRMTGDDLRLRCETVLPASSADFMQWSVPNTVLANRIKYNRTRSDGRIHFDVLYSRRNTLEITVTNLSETDSGDYRCSDFSNYITEKDSRTVEVFDEAGGRYLRLGEQNKNLSITGRKGETIMWLLDLTDSLSATIRKYCYFDQLLYNIRDVFQIRTASKHGAPLLLFRMENLTPGRGGWYRVFFDHMNEALEVGINVDVQEPPIARMWSWKRLLQTGEMGIDVGCWSVESPEPNVTIVIEECPKYPFLRNCSLNYGQGPYEVREGDGYNHYREFNISMSGILSCKACNTLGCNVTTEHILFFATDEPYFTSTNLNKSEVVLDVERRGSSEPIILECYAAGNPYPNVTWFKDGVNLEESTQHKFAYDNRELSILLLFGDKGGRYACRAENDRGHVENYIDIRLQGSSDQETGFSTSVIAVIVTLLVLVVVSCVVSYRLYLKASRKKLADLAFEKGALERFNPELSVVDQAELLPYDLKWEYPRGLLKLGKTLGSGAFGIVRKAEAKSICRGEAVTTVAVKLVRSTASLNFMTALTRELKILAYLGKHPNVVNLLGACTQNVFFGELYVIVEYCRFGNLRDYLLNGRDDFVDQISVVPENVDSSLGLDYRNTNSNGLNTNVDVCEGSSVPERRCQGTSITGTSEASDEDGDLDQDSGEAQRLRSKYDGDCTDLDVDPISPRDLVYWSWQVSRGMEFLGERRIVHGDLAARNILLADNGIVKVCDFGLAKALYKEAEYRDTGSNPLPVKWMAIESIKDQIFSVQSDVWSFGIVMWEIFSLGETPYPGIRQRGLVQKLIDGYRMERPKYAPTTIYDMMQKCWDADPTKRPSFVELSHNVGDSLDYDFKTQYLEMHAHYMEMNAEIADNERADYLTLSVDATSGSRMRERIEMNSLPQDVSETAV